MPTTPLTDEEYLRLLRDLKRQRQHVEDMHDRFDDDRLSGDTQRLEEEIARIPAHIRQADEREFKLELLTCAVEDTIVARAAQFLPDMGDLWAAVQAMPERRDKPETPAEAPVVSLLDEVRALGASDEQVKAAVLRAAALESYTSPLASKRYSGARRKNPPRDYHNVLRQQAGEFLKKRAMPINSGAALVAIIEQWQREPESAEASFWTRFYSQSILSAIAVLRRLGASDGEINGLLQEAYSRWERKQR
jgi:hypothetical protein